jgi:DNA-binding NtrC family response regulator
VVAATNRNLRDAIAAGRFREDLYFRLNVIPISIEPLRGRREDILPLARFFLARHAERPLALSAEAEARLHRHDWPGNVRELENAIERGAILARGERLEPEDLLLEPAVETAERAAAGAGGTIGVDAHRDERAGRRGASGAETPADDHDGTLQRAVDRATEERVRGALRETSGRRAEAARLLGVERTTLYRLIKRFGIED